MVPYFWMFQCVRVAWQRLDDADGRGLRIRRCRHEEAALAERVHCRRACQQIGARGAALQ